ncbi:AraC family transcriptional regulator [Paraclostridium bifermentans]|nr:AraC family transcriptional regulator [Paraclostridium bifermentans]
MNLYLILHFNVGFNGISYYGKIFKKHMNCTPSQYRRKYNIYI